MSLVTEVIVGNDESEWVKLGRAAMDDELFCEEDEDMSVAREALELEEVVEDRLLVAMGSDRGGCIRVSTERAAQRTDAGGEKR